jgi:hypothetical protein
MAVGNKKSKALVGTTTLTENQKEVLESYVKHRSIERVARELDKNPGEVLNTYRSKSFQLALKEYNDSILDTIDYNPAVIIDQLWQTYGQEGISHKDKINILTLLGKHIGMWSPKVPTEGDGKPSIQYNIVNYHGISAEIEKNEKEVKPLIESSSVPEGFEVTIYD